MKREEKKKSKEKKFKISWSWVSIRSCFLNFTCQYFSYFHASSFALRLLFSFFHPMVIFFSLPIYSRTASSQIRLHTERWTNLIWFSVYFIIINSVMKISRKHNRCAITKHTLHLLIIFWVDMRVGSCGVKKKTMWIRRQVVVHFFRVNFRKINNN